MKTIKRSSIIFLLLLAACAHAPQQAVQANNPPVEQEAKPNSLGDKPEPPLNLPSLELNEQMLYELLLGEMANQRGNSELAVQIYMALAHDTLDPRIARRAAQLALDARQMDRAVEALNLWVKLEPGSHQAKQLLVTVLVTGGRLEEARPYLAEMLAAYPGKEGHTFTQVYPLLAQYPDKDAVLSLLRELVKPYPQAVEGHLALAQAAAAAGKREVALDEVRQVRALRPESEMAVRLEAQMLQQGSPQQAVELLKKYLAAYPGAGETRLLYARLLLEQKQYAESRAEFRQLFDEHPDSADLAFTVAMLSLEMGELDRANDELRLALTKGKKDEGTVYYYLGQLNETRKLDAAALEDYRRVQDGEYAYAAHLRVAYLLYKAGKLDEAREYLHQAVARDNQQRVQLMLIEAQLLRDAKQPEAAYQVLTQGLKNLPNHPELLYETAMMAEQIGKHDVFEQLMRKVIEVKPDYAQAYNALGYGMLERNERVGEGMQLVEKAIQLAPDDAGIMDSVGWGHYRLGNLPKSLDFLRRAYNVSPDPEIAAHLGEVLWVQGEKDQARKVWGDALKSHPGSKVLQEVMRKFLP